MSWLLNLLPGGNIAVGGLNFLTSRIGMALLAAVIAFGAGYRMADHNADVVRLRDQLASVQRDLDTASGAERLARAQAASQDALNQKNQDRINALLADLQKRAPGDRCPLGRLDAERLRGIR